jgi:hypothetical protein
LSHPRELLERQELARGDPRAGDAQLLCGPVTQSGAKLSIVCSGIELWKRAVDMTAHVFREHRVWRKYPSCSKLLASVTIVRSGCVGRRGMFANRFGARPMTAQPLSSNADWAIRDPESFQGADGVYGPARRRSRHVACQGGPGGTSGTPG